MNATIKNLTLAALALALGGCMTPPKLPNNAAYYRDWPVGHAYQSYPSSSSYLSTASSASSRSHIADLLIMDMYLSQPIYGYGFRQPAPFVPMPITWGNRH